MPARYPAWAASAASRNPGCAAAWRRGGGFLLLSSSGDGQDCFAWRVRLGGGLERLPALAQREDLADHRAQLALVDELGELRQLGGVRGDNEERGEHAERSRSVR